MQRQRVGCNYINLITTVLNAVNILDAPLALALPFFSLISFTFDALFTLKHEQIQFFQVIFNYLHFTLVLTAIEDIL